MATASDMAGKSSASLERPAWVRRLNEEGECMDISGVVPLDEKSLLESAMRSTGLSDFGSDEWRQPFHVFVNALEDEAQLNLIGRLRTRSEILQLLEARLQIEDTFKRHPEINDEQIVQPIVVVGQGRSGTSFLINVLASNPENGALLQWECVFPCPPPEKATYRSDPRIDKAHELIRQWFRVTPEMSTIHEFDARLPQEDVHILSMCFMAPQWLGLYGQVPSYHAWMATQDIMPALHYHQRVLKLLQWKNPRQRWVLKNIAFLDQMDMLLKIYPAACLVWPHRDPVRAAASMGSAIAVTLSGRSDHALASADYEFVTDPQHVANRLNKVIDQLDAGVVPPTQLFHMHYHDLVNDPLRKIEEMYCHFGIALSDAGRQSMLQYLNDNPRDARAPHRFSLGPDAAVKKARRVFHRYQQRFGIADE